jgi:GNAT superfamily N-acetyltransferase
MHATRPAAAPVVKQPVLSVESQSVDEIRFEQVESEKQKQEAAALIREYLEWQNDRLRRDYGMEFDVEAMVKSDPSDTHKFYPPDGRFYLAFYQNQIAGVGCLKRLEAEVAEVQRMYVLPAYRGKGIGRAMINQLINEARSMGCRRFRLESLEFLEAAHSLYRSAGFRDIDPYGDNSMKS